jgi:hypothetical protein
MTKNPLSRRECQENLLKNFREQHSWISTRITYVLMPVLLAGVAGCVHNVAPIASCQVQKLLNKEAQTKFSGWYCGKFCRTGRREWYSRGHGSARSLLRSIVGTRHCASPPFTSHTWMELIWFRQPTVSGDTKQFADFANWLCLSNGY